jgi:hypothetical protein
MNKKSSERISKSSLNRASINHKKSNSWSICHIAKQNAEREHDWSKLKEKRESQNRESLLSVWQETFVQRLLLSDRENSFD